MKTTLIRVIAGIGLLALVPLCVMAQTPEATGAQYNRVLYQSNIEKESGSEVLIREAYFPPGWKAPRHYHNGNLFIYVIEGEFEVTMEPDGKKTYRGGEALQMKPGITMDARNPSNTNPLKLSVFQVGKPNAPFVVPVE
jgi:quercetin dioxygenase-like cupin family protein